MIEWFKITDLIAAIHPSCTYCHLAVLNDLLVDIYLLTERMQAK